ncbi:DUF2975 domain-containing protein [Paenibacillus methanolicus]|uniref:DUF2975 family protein n=1 Tax=Paenibacillus methanolicus TaxID=582686 RepID=A0A5S5CHG8_9BACL|nr:DUF2975 domain-containing protein [Paenibacillus methanolicus]TYP79226.1 Protein of unknown function (DUF2975) [Paenibacillus methanolicus]
MQRGTIFFLKAAVVLTAIPVLALCLIGLPSVANEAAQRFPAIWLYPVIIGLYATAFPFFIALHQAYRLLRLIDENLAFSESTISGLRKIKTCAAAISMLYAAFMPCLLMIAQEDDAPGLAALGLFVIVASLTIGFLANVLGRVWQEAIAMKAIHDLMV